MVGAGGEWVHQEPRDKMTDHGLLWFKVDFTAARHCTWPHCGGSQRREPKELLQKSKTCKLVAKQAFQARIGTIFCMREATYISDGFRMRAGPSRPLKRTQN